MRLPLVLLTSLVLACGPTAAGPSPSATASSTVQPTATTTATPSPSPSQQARISLSDTPITGSGGKLLLIQMPNERRLRAMTWEADTTGTLPGTTASTGWSQAPYGSPFLTGTSIYDREGKLLGTVPWSAMFRPTWSPEGSTLCAAVPDGGTGSAMRLERFTIGATVKVVASGFTTYSDNAGFPVLACDTASDRAIVAVFGQGIAPARAYVIRLSTGAIARTIQYDGTGWVVASTDASMLADTVTAQGKSTTTVRRTDDGTSLGLVDDFVVRGFSGDGSLLIGMTGGNVTTLVDWKAGRRVWSSTGTFAGFFPEPAGSRVAVGFAAAGGYETRDVYVVSADGKAVLLPEGVRISAHF